MSFDFEPARYVESDAAVAPLRAIDTKALPRIVATAAAPETLSRDLPPEQWLQRVIQAILETVHGYRQPQQLRAVVAAPTLQIIMQRRTFVTAFNRKTVPRVISLKFWNQQNSGTEISAICEISGRYFPIALQVKKQATTWLVVACEIGPY